MEIRDGINFGGICNVKNSVHSTSEIVGLTNGGVKFCKRFKFDQCVFVT